MSLSTSMEKPHRSKAKPQQAPLVAPLLKNGESMWFSSKETEVRNEWIATRQSFEEYVEAIDGAMRELKGMMERVIEEAFEGFERAIASRNPNPSHKDEEEEERGMTCPLDGKAEMVEKETLGKGTAAVLQHLWLSSLLSMMTLSMMTLPLPLQFISPVFTIPVFTIPSKHQSRSREHQKQQPAKRKVLWTFSHGVLSQVEQTQSKTSELACKCLFFSALFHKNKWTEEMELNEGYNSSSSSSSSEVKSQVKTVVDKARINDDDDDDGDDGGVHHTTNCPNRFMEREITTSIDVEEIPNVALSVLGSHHVGPYPPFAHHPRMYDVCFLNNRPYVNRQYITNGTKSNKIRYFSWNYICHDEKTDDEKTGMNDTHVHYYKNCYKNCQCVPHPWTQVPIWELFCMRNIHLHHYDRQEAQRYAPSSSSVGWILSLTTLTDLQNSGFVPRTQLEQQDTEQRNQRVQVPNSGGPSTLPRGTLTRLHSSPWRSQTKHPKDQLIPSITSITPTPTLDGAPSPPTPDDEQEYHRPMLLEIMLHYHQHQLKIQHLMMHMMYQVYASTKASTMDEENTRKSYDCKSKHCMDTNVNDNDTMVESKMEGKLEKNLPPNNNFPQPTTKANFKGCSHHWYYSRSISSNCFVHPRNVIETM